MMNTVCWGQINICNNVQNKRIKRKSFNKAGNIKEYCCSKVRSFVSLPHACRITQEETLNGKPAASVQIRRHYKQDYSGWCRTIFWYSKYTAGSSSPTGSALDPQQSRPDQIHRRRRWRWREEVLVSDRWGQSPEGSEVKGQGGALSPVLSKRDIILLHGLDLRVSVSIFLLFNWDKHQRHLSLKQHIIHSWGIELTCRLNMLFLWISDLFSSTNITNKSRCI